ncbi:hypothetical protein [Paenibacillus wulumuqiensis]|uniref:hypothetical protein n=1 Tax=Paenibacillus wulumuqiensis TaxID=1567107 RepID=UPI000695B60A|nr:hypothetical protein [Paenibacillus wulumuqiensis]
MIILKITIVLAALTLTICLAGCSKETAAPSPQEPAAATNPTAPAPSEQASSAEEEPTAKPITDKINWDQVNDPLVNDAMKAQLQAAIDAMAAGDVDQFLQAIGRDMGTAFDYLLNNKMEFTTVLAAYKESGRIVVPIQGHLKKTKEESELFLSFYFVKDKGGEWKLGSID